jgi:hypothetical protein
MFESPFLLCIINPNFKKKDLIPFIDNLCIHERDALALGGTVFLYIALDI